MTAIRIEIQEYAAGSPKGVDREKHVIRGVKLLGLRSVNRGGYSYPTSTLENAIPLFEGKAVYIDHKPKPRSLVDRFGTVKGVTLDPARGLIGDIHYNPGHPLAEQALKGAESLPDSFGCSPSLDGELAGAGGPTAHVRRISRVDSVDLVSEPATTGGIFESRQGDHPMDIATATLDQIMAARPDFKTEIERRAAESVESKTLREQVETLTAQVKATNEALAAEKSKIEKATKRAAAETKITEAKLPSWLATDAVKTELLEAAEAGTFDARLAHYKALAAAAPAGNGSTPTSKLQEGAGAAGAPDVSKMTAKEFAGRLVR